jgi:ferritin-like metal-binding protein YciE
VPPAGAAGGAGPACGRTGVDTVPVFLPRPINNSPSRAAFPKGTWVAEAVLSPAQPQSRQVPMAALRSAEDLLQSELKEIYSAERQLSRALPKLMKKVSSEQVRQMLDQRREQAATLIEQLDEAFDEMDVTKGRPKNVAAEGLIDDANQHIEQIDDVKFLDPLLIASMQKIEHYCIAAWGTAASMGRLLGREKVVETMERVLEEGRRFDDEMTRIAEKEVNPRMLADGEGEDEKGSDDEKRGERKTASRGNGGRRKAQ